MGLGSDGSDAVLQFVHDLSLASINRARMSLVTCCSIPRIFNAT